MALLSWEANDGPSEKGESGEGSWAPPVGVEALELNRLSRLSRWLTLDLLPPETLQEGRDRRG